MPPLPSSLQSSGAELRSQQNPPPTLELPSQPGRSASELGVCPRTLLAPLLKGARPETTCPGAIKCLLSTSLYECKPLIQSFVSRSGKGTAAWQAPQSSSDYVQGQTQPPHCHRLAQLPGQLRDPPDELAPDRRHRHPLHRRRRCPSLPRPQGLTEEESCRRRCCCRCCCSSCCCSLRPVGGDSN